MIQGWVSDDAQVPVAGAAIRLVGHPHNATTGADGGYQIRGLPDAELLTFVVETDAHEPASATVQQRFAGERFTVNFTLARAPDQAPFVEVLEFTGFLSCGFIAQVGHDHGQNPHNHTSYDCGGGNLTQDNVWLLPLKAGVTAGVFEVFWEPGTPLAENLVIFVEGAGVDDGADVFFSFYEGRSGMKGTISRLQAAQYYGESDGLVRFTILPGAPEQEVAVGAHINQQYEVIASLFYGEVPSPTYSAVSG